MTALAIADWQQDVIDLLGAAVAGGPVPDAQAAQVAAALAVKVPAWWAMQSFRPSPYLAALYTRLRAIQFVQGQLRPLLADVSLGPLRLQRQALWRDLLDMHRQAVEEIAAERRVHGYLAPAVGALARVAPFQAGTPGTSPDVTSVGGASVVQVPLVPLAPPGPGLPPQALPYPDPTDPSLGGLPTPSDPLRGAFRGRGS